MTKVKSQSRTHNSLRNSLAAIFLSVGSLLLSFISRKIFLNHLGAEVLGLNTTASNLLSFLNLAELGIGSAVAFSLYQPILSNDKDKINEIITLQGLLYRKIAIIIIFIAIILSFFFPLIFKKMVLPIWYAYASFGVLLFSSLLSYFVNYKQIILSASQQEYIITFSYKLVLLSRLIVQIIVISIASNGYIWWLITEVVFTILATVTLNLQIKRKHPYLKANHSTLIALTNKYSTIVTKVKQLFFHRIGGFVIFQSSSIIIYAFLDLTTVAFYGNYMMIVNGITLLLNSLFNGVGASVGNLIATNNKKLIINTFNELFCFRFLMTASSCICLYTLSNTFIELWLGNNYVFHGSTLMLITINTYFFISRGVVDTYINGFGLFNDIYAPVVESLLFIIGAIVGGFIDGLNGIILGSIISQIIIILIWKPYFLFKYGFNTDIMKYVWMYLKCLFSGVLGFVVILIINHIRGGHIASDFYQLIYISIIYFSILIIVIGLFELILLKGMKDFFKRIKLVIIKK